MRRGFGKPRASTRVDGDDAFVREDAQTRFLKRRASSGLSGAESLATYVEPPEMATKTHHKVEGLLFWAGNFYLWYAVIGLAFVPLGLYFTALVKSVFVTNKTEHGPHAEQVGIVVMLYAWLLSAIFIYPTYCVFGPYEWLKYAFLAYIAWYALLDRQADSSGVRFVRAMRQLPFWRVLAEYFPVRLHVSSELDPKGNYLFGYHPHGVIGVGALLTFATEATGFYEAFPGLDLRLLTLSINFKFPFTREVLMALGVNSVTKTSVMRNLTRKPGASVAIVVGGAAEALDARPGWATLTLARRKGFVKMALRTGASLVPVFAFGENDIFEQVENPEGGRLRSFQLYIKQLIGITPPAFYGRSLSRGIWRRIFGRKGVLPKREPIEVVVGKPIAVPKVSDPSPELVDKYHNMYTESLKELYELHRRQFHKLNRGGSSDDLLSDLLMKRDRLQSMKFI